jgi:hypothetical protein
VDESENEDLALFSAIREAVLDIDGEADNYVPLREVLPSK